MATKIEMAMAIAFVLVTSEQFRNRVIKHIKECENDETYKPYLQWTQGYLQGMIEAYGGDSRLADEFDDELELRLYQALQKGLEQFGIYTRADGDKLFVKQSIVELC